jgi:hypothetical protein
MEKSRSENRRLWSCFAAAAVLVIIVAAIRWSLAHPYGIHWDEAEYFDDVLIDITRLRTGALLRLGGRLLLNTRGIPPAFRILAIPFLVVFGFHATIARLTSLGCYALSSYFIYLATRRVASPVAGAFAALVFSLSPEVISGSIFFSTDAPLYLATSAMFYYIFTFWMDESDRTSNWIGLGLAVGLGFLAKTSFFLIGPPVFAFWFLANQWGRLGLPSWASSPLRKAGALAFLVGGPWWLLNAKSAFAYGKYAQNFVRDSLGPPSPATWAKWLNTVLQCLLGHGVSLLIVLVLAVLFVELAIRKKSILDRLQIAVLGACACAGLPIVAAQLVGTNHLLRHISPAMVPLAIASGVLADETVWVHSSLGMTVSFTLFAVQLAMLVSPVIHPNTQIADLGFDNAALPWRTMSRFDQWDWRPVREIGESCGLPAPEISFLGSGRAFDPPQIIFPWIAQDVSDHKAELSIPNVVWLWRYEDGPLDWQKVMEQAQKSDIVITAPTYVGEVENKENLDNQYNAEFENRLLQDTSFRGPIRLEMGRFAPVEVDVFLKTTLVCSSGRGVPSN